MAEDGVKDSWEVEDSKPSPKFVPRVGAPAFVPRADAPSFVPGGFAQPPPPPKPAPVADQPEPEPEPVADAEPAAAEEPPSALQAADEADTAADSVAESLAEVKVEEKVEVPEPEAGPADEARIMEAFKELQKEDSRTHLNVVFIGHVDAGKSTLGGQILFLTGGVDKRTIEKYEREAKDKNRESWYMAYIMDTNEEERTKGITVEVGRAKFETVDRRYTILDAPGHKNYVPNMIMGAAQADVAVLVISSRKGEYETGFEKGGQTREHAQLAKTLGVVKLVVVVNKLDDHSVALPNGQWSQDR
jgi:peptide chain release factor subunit 3